MVRLHQEEADTDRQLEMREEYYRRTEAPGLVYLHQAVHQIVQNYGGIDREEEEVETHP